MVRPREEGKETKMARWTEDLLETKLEGMLDRP